MQKRKLMALKDLPVTEEMLEASEQEKLEKRTEYYNYYTHLSYQYGCYYRADICESILKVSIYLAEHIRFGGCGTKPRYNIYIDKGKNEFLVYDFLYRRWSSACIWNLEWPRYISGSSEYIDENSRACIRKYLGDGKPQEAIQSFQDKLRQDKRMQRHKACMDVWAEQLHKVPMLPKDWDNWVRKTGTLKNYIFYEYKKSGVKEGYCTWCEKTVPVKGAKHNKTSKCSCCNRPIEYKSVNRMAREVSSSETVYLLQRCGEKVVLREFIAQKVYDKESYMDLQFECTERRRILYDENFQGTEFYYGLYKGDFKGWIQGTLKHGFLYREPTEYEEGRVYGKSLSSLAKKELKKTGFVEMLKKYKKISPVTYFYVYNAFPNLERLIKANLFGLVEDVFDSYKRPGITDNSDLAKALGIDKFRMGRLRQKQGSLLYLEWLKYEKKKSTVIADETIDWFVHNGIHPDKIQFIVDRMSVLQVKNYLQKQQRGSGRTIKSLISTWEDYLDMAKRAKVDINDKIIYRARYLLKRHEEMIQLIESLDLELKVAEINEKYPGVEKVCKQIREKYAYEGKDYKVIVPTGTEDILNEGRYLHHCINKKDVYFSRIIDGESYILFLRKTENADAHYYTLEVEPDAVIRQKRTEFDRQKADIDDVTNFLKSWQKEVQKRLKKEDYEAAKRSRRLRECEIKDLRKKKVRIHGEFRGELLADILERDLLEVEGHEAA